jgi:hypothetical protein
MRSHRNRLLTIVVVGLAGTVLACAEAEPEEAAHDAAEAALVLGRSEQPLLTEQNSGTWQRDLAKALGTQADKLAAAIEGRAAAVAQRDDLAAKPKRTAAEQAELASLNAAIQQFSAMASAAAKAVEAANKGSQSLVK